MSKLSKVALLSNEDRNRLDTIIRSHNYYQLDKMVKEARKQGILTSRTALHTYVQKLVKQDGAKCPVGMDEKPNIVFIVDLLTGDTKTIFTAASADQIKAAISSQKHPPSLVS